ncbi:MAG: glycosyltransferase family 39 protein [Bacteroidetes bacterium]|nr:glycosyltransferase family 39 protein [Bacteroidota bacterium]
MEIRNILSWVSRQWDQNPLKVIMILALFTRLLTAFFSPGFLFHDDHFDVITPAQNWVYGLKQWMDPTDPPRHSMFFTGIHYLISYGLESMGLVDAGLKMLVIRVFHASYSLLTVYLGYKLTETISNRTNASLVGLILTLLWFMPFYSVRNLVEMACIPPVLYGFYMLVSLGKNDRKQWVWWVLAGGMFGIAFSLRYHTILLAGGLGLVLLYRKEWIGSILFSSGFLFLSFVLIGLIDIQFYEYPFHSIVRYYEFNSANAYNFITGPPYKFIIVVFGFLIPPVSLMLMVGFIKGHKIEPMMFIAVLVFFLFHSFFPNKQERFMLPILPLIVILGTIGWQKYYQHSDFWQQRKKIISYSWKFFWILNVLAVLLLAFTYPKRGRIETMRYLGKQPDLGSVVMETSRTKLKANPEFYLGKMAARFKPFQSNRNYTWTGFKEAGRHLSGDFVLVFTLTTKKSLEHLQLEIKETGKRPNYITFLGKENLELRIERMVRDYGSLEFKKYIPASDYDNFLHFLNPKHNHDENAWIYKVKEFKLDLD